MLTRASELQALILAGGEGSRLRRLVSDRAKTMADVSGRPFAEYVVRQLQRAGIRDIVMCVGNHADSVKAYFADGGAWGMSIRYSTELRFLGTAGALRLARDLVTAERTLVLNGDSLFEIDFDRLLECHCTNGARMTIALRDTGDSQRYGAVVLGQDNQVTEFREKQHSARSLINGGIYLMETEVLDLVPEGTKVSLEHEIFPALVGRGLYGVPFGGYFVDMGTTESYLSLLAQPAELQRAVGLS